MRVAAPPIVVDRFHAGHADSCLGQAFAPRASEAVADDDRHRDLQPPFQFPRQPCCRASGSSGNSSACKPPSTFETSTPLFAQINPCFVSVIRTPRFLRTTRLASRSASSVTRGSKPYRCAHSVTSGRRGCPAEPVGLPPWIQPCASPPVHRPGRATCAAQPAVHPMSASASPGRISPATERNDPQFLHASLLTRSQRDRR